MKLRVFRSLKFLLAEGHFGLVYSILSLRLVWDLDGTPGNIGAIYFLHYLVIAAIYDNPSEDVVYNDSIDMSSFLPVGEQQQQEIEAVRFSCLKMNQWNGPQCKMSH